MIIHDNINIQKFVNQNGRQETIVIIVIEMNLSLNFNYKR